MYTQILTYSLTLRNVAGTDNTQVTLFIGLHQILVLSGENLAGIPIHTGCSESA